MSFAFSPSHTVLCLPSLRVALLGSWPAQSLLICCFAVSFLLFVVSHPQVPDESEQFYELSMDNVNEHCISEVQVYYNDDLTEG